MLHKSVGEYDRLTTSEQLCCFSVGVVLGQCHVQNHTGFSPSLNGFSALKVPISESLISLKTVQQILNKVLFSAFVFPRVERSIRDTLTLAS